MTVNQASNYMKKKKKKAYIFNLDRFDYQVIFDVSNIQIFLFFFSGIWDKRLYSPIKLKGQ